MTHSRELPAYVTDANIVSAAVTGGDTAITFRTIGKDFSDPSLQYVSSTGSIVGRGLCIALLSKMTRRILSDLRVDPDFGADYFTRHVQITLNFKDRMVYIDPV